MVFMRKKLFMKMLSKSFIDDSKAQKKLKFSDWLFCLHSCKKKCIDVFPFQAAVLSGHLFLFLSVDFISGLIATKFLALLNHELLSSETFSGILFSHEYSVIEISKFCTQTKTVRNGWKFPVAKWTD